MQNYLGKMTAEIQRLKQAQHGFLIDGKATRQVCKLHLQMF